MNYRATAVLDCRGLDNWLYARTKLSPAGYADPAEFPGSGSTAGPAGGVFRGPEVVGRRRPHTVRGFVSILGSKGGEKIESSKNDVGERI